MSERFFRAIYRAGCRLRGTPVLELLDRLNDSQWWSCDEFREHQLARVRELLEHAGNHSPFYRDYFTQHGFDPHIGSLADLRRLPPVEREEIQTNAGSIQNDGRGGKLIYSKSSGCSGVPLSFHRSLEWDAGHRAAVLRGHGWYGAQYWMRSAMIWGIPSSKKERLKVRIGDFIHHRFREDRFDLSGANLERFYRKLSGAEYLEGYPSLLHELALHVNREHPGNSELSLRMVKGTSESIHPHYQGDALKAFGRRIVSEYGAAETGIISFECPEGSHHVNMEHVIVDVEDDEIIVTNLLSFSFPFIRYRLGDYVIVREGGFVCPCGRQGQVLGEIIGRVGTRVYGKDGAIFPSMTVDYIIKSLPRISEKIIQCQAVQREKGRLEFLVVTRKLPSDGERAGIERAFEGLVRPHYGDAVEYGIEFVESIPRRGRKHREFISELSEESRG